MKRTDIDERKEEILQWISENKSKAYMAKELNCNPKTIASKLIEWGVDYKGNPSHKGEHIEKRYISAKEYFGTDKPITSYKLKIKLLKEGIKKYRCEKCGNSFWLNKPIPLELHHKNGNHNDNSFENLQVLCPNCHSIQEGNSGANIGKYERMLELEDNFDLESKAL